MSSTILEGSLPCQKIYYFGESGWLAYFNFTLKNIYSTGTTLFVQVGSVAKNIFISLTPGLEPRNLACVVLGQNKKVKGHSVEDHTVLAFNVAVGVTSCNPSGQVNLGWMLYKMFWNCNQEMDQIAWSVYSRCQCYNTFYHSNLLHFHGNTIILCHKMILLW